MLLPLLLRRRQPLRCLSLLALAAGTAKAAAVVAVREALGGCGSQWSLAFHDALSAASAGQFSLTVRVSVAIEANLLFPKLKFVAGYHPLLSYFTR